MTLFLFTDDPLPYRSGRLVLRVPAEVADKKALLSCYAEGLSLPDYFGWNWDALADCLSDLSWIAEDEIAILHADMPLKGILPDEVIYREILSDAARHWQDDGRRRITIVFPSALRNEMAAT